MDETSFLLYLLANCILTQCAEPCQQFDIQKKNFVRSCLYRFALDWNEFDINHLKIIHLSHYYCFLLHFYVLARVWVSWINLLILRNLTVVLLEFIIVGSHINLVVRCT